MTKTEIMQQIIEKQDELIRRKCQHKPNCYLRQDWSETLQEMREVPQIDRDEDWYSDMANIAKNMKTCSCGLDDFIKELATLKSQLKEGGGEEKPPNDGGKCVCKFYPAECLYCYNLLVEDSY